MTIARKFMAHAKSFFAIATTVIALTFAGPAAFAQNAQDTQTTSATTSQQQPVSQEVRNTLSQYGRFVQHEKYGEVWLPTVTPQGWHPYAPCNWVNSKQYGWYYDDKTPWGQIVHHYGRWAHDAQMGWVWTPGSEFSPGWVVWRTSKEWVGWAPMLPDQDVQTISASEFNNAGHWIFVETRKFAQGCGSVAPASQVPVLLKQTTYVTDVRFVGGIVVIVLPSYVVGPVVIIDIHFGPWPNWFLSQMLLNLNFVWNNLVVVNVAVNCAPQQIKPAQLNDAPKPQPVSDPQPPSRPEGKPQGGNPPIIVVDPAPKCPLGTAFNDGICRPINLCRTGTVRVGNECVAVRPDPKPPVCPIGMVFDDGACRKINPRRDPKPPVVNNDPCAGLSGVALRRCTGGTPTIDPKPPVKRPVIGSGDSGGPIKVVNPVKPTVNVRPQFDAPKTIRDNGPSRPAMSMTTMPRQSVMQPQRRTFIR